LGSLSSTVSYFYEPMMRVCPRIESFIRILVRQERGCEAGLKGDQVSHSFKKFVFFYFFLFFLKKSKSPPVPKVVTDRTPIPVVTTVVNVYPYIPVILMYTSCIPVPHTGTHVLRKLKKINIRFSSHAPLIFSTIPCKGDFFLNESQRYHIYRATELLRLI